MPTSFCTMACTCLPPSAAWPVGVYLYNCGRSAKFQLDRLLVIWNLPTCLFAVLKPFCSEHSGIIDISREWMEIRNQKISSPQLGRPNWAQSILLSKGITTDQNLLRLDVVILGWGLDVVSKRSQLDTNQHAPSARHNIAAIRRR